jgi:hypothetical protein
MCKALTISILIFSSTLLTSGAEFSGHLMDTMCAANKLDQASSHTAQCMKDCAKSGYGLVTKDGKYLKFNEGGNAKALTALKADNREANLQVKVTGELKGSMIRVESIQMQ